MYNVKPLKFPLIIVLYKKKVVIIITTKEFVLIVIDKEKRIAPNKTSSSLKEFK